MEENFCLEVTTICDANCIMCPRDEYPFRFKTMDWETYKLCVSRLKEHFRQTGGGQTIGFGGYGDIFMCKKENLLQYMQYIKDEIPDCKLQSSSTCNAITEDKLPLLEYLDVLRVSMYGMDKQTYESVHKEIPDCKLQSSSTCNAITEDKLPLLEYLDVLRVSMYGMDKQTYESVHKGSVKFERVWENIHRILDYDKRPYLSFNYVILKQNKHHIEQWKEYWEKRVDEIQIWKPHNFGGFYDTLELQGLKDSIEIKAFSEAKDHPKCNRIYGRDMIIRENGEVSLCCFDPHRKFIMGDLHTQSLKQIQNGEPIKNVQRIFKENKVFSSNLICKVCDQITDRSDSLVYSNAPVEVGKTNNVAKRVKKHKKE